MIAQGKRLKNQILVILNTTMKYVYLLIRPGNTSTFFKNIVEKRLINVKLKKVKTSCVKAKSVKLYVFRCVHLISKGQVQFKNLISRGFSEMQQKQQRQSGVEKQSVLGNSSYRETYCCDILLTRIILTIFYWRLCMGPHWQ